MYCKYHVLLIVTSNVVDTASSLKLQVFVIPLVSVIYEVVSMTQGYYSDAAKVSCHSSAMHVVSNVGIALI